MESNQKTTLLKEFLIDPTEENRVNVLHKLLDEKMKKLEKRQMKVEMEHEFTKDAHRSLLLSITRFQTKLDTFPDPLKSVTIALQTVEGGLHRPIVKPGQMHADLVKIWMTQL